jgi:hypothetical protein
MTPNSNISGGTKKQSTENTGIKKNKNKIKSRLDFDRVLLSNVLTV